MNKILHLAWLLLITSTALGQIIPLAEHPRPDFERPDWLNLNGAWEFEFDSSNQGVSEKWFQTEKKYSKKIMVPFPWGSALSGVKDEADIAWYRKTFTVPKGWDLKKKIFLTIGASDWETTVWLNGRLIGQHQGGYMPFSFELNITAIPNAPHTLTIKVDDKRRPFTLYGKQGYGNARGIWQTAYLESRGHQAIDAIRCIPDIDKNKVIVQVDVDANQPNQTVQVTILTPNGPISKKTSSIAYKSEVELEFDLPNAKRWTLSDPYLYTLTVETLDDKVMSYFGMRKISVMKLPNTEIPYIALNNQPIYLQLALDQSYHPEGFYTFPSDTFIREEIQRSRQCKGQGEESSAGSVHLASQRSMEVKGMSAMARRGDASIASSKLNQKQFLRNELSYVLDFH